MLLHAISLPTAKRVCVTARAYVRSRGGALSRSASAEGALDERDGAAAAHRSSSVVSKAASERAAAVEPFVFIPRCLACHRQLQ